MAKATNDLFLSSSGLATFGPEVVRIIELLEGCFLSWAEEFKADAMIFPPLIRVEDLNRLDYFRNFPHLGVFASLIQEGLLRNKYVEGGDVEVIPNEHLADSKYALPSAACYPVYLYLQNTVLDAPKCITTVGKCFRNEEYYRGLERLLCFSLREIVFVGVDEEVRLFLARSKEKILDFAAAIGLPLEVKVAGDPFYDSEGIRAKMQRRFPVKEELVYEGKLALASVNFHLSFFGDRCNIRTRDEKFAFSGCVGMGIERWMYALMEQFDGNVGEICDVLSSYQKHFKMNLNHTKTPKLTNRFEEALVYASRLHAQQVRKVNGFPYISHLLSVAALVLEDGGDEDEAIAALLHDAIEDQGGEKTRQAIYELFGKKVAIIVESCTESDAVPRPPWRERKQKSIENLRRASPEVRRVILADKLHNARSLLTDWYRYGELIWKRLEGEKDEIIWFYRAVLEVNQKAGYNFLTEELKKVVKELENCCQNPHKK